MITSFLYSMSASFYTPLLASPLTPEVRATMYSIQYTLAKQPTSFATTLDAVDIFLATYTTQHAISEDSVLFISAERRKKEHISYLWQELAIRFSSIEEFYLFTTALDSLSPHITIKRYNHLCTLYIDNIPTHSIHAQIIEPMQDAIYLTIIIDDVGENYSLLKEFIAVQIPLTFAVWPFASRTKASIQLLQSHKASTIIHLPMEPMGYPNVSPGKGVLTTTMSAQEIEERTYNALQAVPNAIGINNHMGSFFTTQYTQVNHFIRAIKRMRPDFYIVDSLTHPKSLLYSTAQRSKLTAFSRSIFIDNIRTTQDTLQALYKAQHIAKKYGKAIAIGHLAPTTLTALKEFLKKKDNHVHIITLEHYAQLL